MLEDEVFIVLHDGITLAHSDNSRDFILTGVQQQNRANRNLSTFDLSWESGVLYQGLLDVVMLNLKLRAPFQNLSQRRRQDFHHRPRLEEGHHGQSRLQSRYQSFRGFGRWESHLVPP